ncbi:two-component sensor histidine kinase [Nonomuraea sp. WAC 01424]|uniref:sensor histidine kinase n=1 Tax=Nonomuraea sp. WAC 01424 TaxID=2203200 RepID=UPI000F7B812C|nr:HAMP domain-containing sensor histidine kinase [Nonomuraea sp. WAC 01424]RSM97644.1 two-component sensor histidine kinase [Nonomuraea sp. WAC 01424]
MNPSSLRWKIAALVTLASTVVAAVVGLLVHRATWQRSLAIGEARAVAAIEKSLAVAGGPADVVSVEELPDALAAQLRPGERVVWYGLDHRDEPWVWAVQPYGDDGTQAVSTQISMGSELRGLYALDRNMAKAGLLALAGVVPLSVLAAELPNRRLRRVARTARRIADGDLAARIGARGRDEIAGISAAVDSMAASLQHRLLAEQRFTADVAHDLRTPLMGLVAVAELLEEGETADLVRDRVRVLRTLVEDLLEVSRLDAGAEVAERVRVPLADLAAESAARVGVTARVLAAGNPVAETDPRRLDRVLANLVLNAHRHGAQPVEITVGDRLIEVRDRGPGFPPELLAEGPRRFRTGAAERGHGHGLGLTIALGQARVIGAELTLSNAPDGGAVATLRLPAG